MLLGSPSGKDLIFSKVLGLWNLSNFVVISHQARPESV
jgi:hypothetical protein